MALDVSNPEIRFALDAAIEAAHITRHIRQSMDVQGISKADFSPVTVADYAAQALVGRKLAGAFPDARLVAEENADDLRTPDAAEVLEVVTRFVGEHHDDATPERVCDWIDHGAAQPDGKYWTLDPIDGTKGYLRGEQYAIALGLIEDGRVMLGVLACPNLGDDGSLGGAGGGFLAAAARGEGAWGAGLNDGADFSPLHVSACLAVKEARLLRSVEAAHTNIDEIGRLAQSMGVQAGPVALDSQAKYAVLAAGGGEVLLRLLSPSKPDYKEKIWDQAAGSIIVEEAGGRVSDLQGRPLDFSHGRTLAENRGLCATNGALHDVVLQAIRDIEGDQPT